MKQKRILIFSISYHPIVGGAEVAIKEITDRLSGLSFDLITLRYDSNLPRYERIGNVSVHRLGFSSPSPSMADLVAWPLKLNKFFYPFLACAKAISLHRTHPYDAIWSMMAAFAGFAGLFFKLLSPRVPFLLSLQEGDPIPEIKRKVGLLYPLFKLIFRRADSIQTISNYLADFARDMGASAPIRVIPNGVDIAHFGQMFPAEELQQLSEDIGKRPADIFLVTVSRLVKKNGIADVIKALPDLPPDLRFLVIGNGPGEEALKELADKLSVTERIIWLGFVSHSEIPKYLKISDIFIRPSLSEGLGNSFLEAMAAGLPVIATPVGGIPDFLFDGANGTGQEQTGYSCNPNDPASIASAVERILGDDELCKRVVRNADEMVRARYDWEIVAREMGELFESIAANRLP